MILTPILVTLGTPATSRTVPCPRGEKLQLHVAVTSDGTAVDLSAYSVLLGWDTSIGSTPKPAPTRVSGDATGIVDFDIETIALLADTYAFDVWLENDTTYERTLICTKSFVRLSAAVSALGYGPSVTMDALAVAVPPGVLAISGTATDVDGTLTAASFGVAVNGVTQTPTFVFAAGAWSASVTVAVGAVSIVVTVTDSLGATATATRTTTASSMLAYYGVGATGRADVVGLTSTPVTAAFGLELIVSPVAQKFYFAWPASLGTPTVSVDGFAMDSLPLVDITVGVVLYKLLESENNLTEPGLVVDVEP